MAAAVLVAFFLSVPAASHTGLATWASIAAASMSFVAMALNQFLATRPRYLEGLFGGLDRIYHTHRQLGIAALVLFLIHYIVTPNFKGLVLTSGLNEMARTAGEIGFYGLVVLAGISLVKRLPKTRIEVPYNLWRQSHRFIGFFFILIAVHLNFIKRPFDGTALLAVYLNIFAAIGVISFIVTQIRPFIARKRYQVSDIIALPSATLVTARAVGRPIAARPGHFAFLKSDRAGLGEPHPFTIARYDPATSSISFAIKPLGDFTRRLRDTLQVGDFLHLEGGYGRFEVHKGGQNQVWLAGGIGITPFLAQVETLRATPDKKVHLFHSVRSEDEAVQRDYLEGLSASLPNFTFTLHASKTNGRLGAAQLIEKSQVAPKGADFWFCGPEAMRLAIVKDLKLSGNAPGKVKFEKFEFR